jgi:hypothetical protein
MSGDPAGMNRSSLVSASRDFLEALRIHDAMSEERDYDIDLGMHQVNSASNNFSWALQACADDFQILNFRNILKGCLRRLLDKLNTRQPWDRVDTAGIEKAVAALESLQSQGQADTPLDMRDLKLPAKGTEAPGLAASGNKAPPPPEAPNDLPDYVTLNQAAAPIHRSKRTLERYKTNGKLPEPAVEGGGGKPDLYDWKVMRPWLESEFRMILPEVHPANRRHA